MAIGLMVGETWRFQIKGDDTVWILRVLDGLTKMDVCNNNKDMALCRELIRVGLAGFENFKNKNGEIQYQTEKANVYGEERDVVPISLIKQMDSQYINKVSMAILEGQSLSEQERKN